MSKYVVNSESERIYSEKNIDDICKNKCIWEWTDAIWVRQLWDVSVSFGARSGFLGSIYSRDLEALSLEPLSLYKRHFNFVVHKIMRELALYKTFTSINQ